MRPPRENLEQRYSEIKPNLVSICGVVVHNDPHVAFLHMSIFRVVVHYLNLSRDTKTQINKISQKSILEKARKLWIKCVSIIIASLGSTGL